MQKPKSQRKGTFAGYEALMDTFGGATAPKQDNDDALRRAHNALSAKYPEESAVPSFNDSPRNTRSAGPRRRRSTDDYPFRTISRDSEEHRRRSHKRDSSGQSSNGQLRGNGERLRVPADWKEHMHLIGEQANRLARAKNPQAANAAFSQAEGLMDYKGVPIAAETPAVTRQTPFPWVQKSGENATASEILHHEMTSFAAYMRLTQPEIAARQSVREALTKLIKWNAGGAMKVDLFGSEVTGLSSATSDLDFRLYPRTEPNSPVMHKSQMENSFTLKIMKKLAERMTASPDWITTVLRHARFPIINAQHRMTGIDVQIVSSPSTEPQQQVTLQYLQQITNLKILYSVMKSMFSIRGLVDVFNGGAGSYGLLMMLVASLTRRGADYTSADVGTQLLQFLDFYCEHDYHSNAIALAPPVEGSLPQTTLFRKHSANTIPLPSYIRAAYAREDPIRAGQWSIGQRRPFQPYLPCIQDPANPLNDLGRKMNAIKHIVATLGQVRTELRGRLERAERGELGEGESLLEPAVGRIHEVYFERRRRVEEYGLEKIREQREREHEEELGRMGEENERPQPVETAWAG